MSLHDVKLYIRAFLIVPFRNHVSRLPLARFPHVCRWPNGESEEIVTSTDRKNSIRVVS